MAPDHRTAGRLLLLLAGMALALAGCEATDVQPIAPVTEPPATATPSPSPSPIGPTSSPSPPTVRMDALRGASTATAGPGSYRYQVDVPQLEGAGPHARSIDNVIRGSMQRIVDDFTTLARDTPTGTTASQLMCTGRPVRLTPRLAVMRVDCAEQLAGAGAADASTRAFNCDLTGGRVLALQDLFSGGSAYLDVLSAAARTQLRARLPAGDDRTFDDGTSPVADNFRTFLLDGKQLIVVLPSRYRPIGTAALVEVTVPYGDLKPYLARTVSDLLGI